MSSSPKPTVLILASRPADFKSAVVYLNRRDLTVQLCRSLNDAIEAIAAGTCQFLLLSIDFPNSRAEILPQVLEQSFPVSVIVFAENHDRRTVQRLGSLRAQNILFSNPSGPSMLARIKQVWLSEKNKRDTNSLHIAKGTPLDKTKIVDPGEKYLTPKEVAEQLLERLNRTAIQHDKQKPKTEEMLFEAEETAFEFLTEAPAVINQERKRRNAPVLEYDDYGNPIGRPQTFETKFHETVWDTADGTLQDICPTKSRLNHMMGPITEAELMCIDSMNFKGTFVVAYSGDEGSPDGSPLFAAETKLVSDLRNRGFHIREQDVTILPMFDFNIPTKLINAADLVVTHSCRQFDLSFAYYASTRLIPMFEAIDDPMLMVDIGQFLPGSTINVDVFLPMPLNNKHVRYWRRGSTLTEEQLTKVASHGAVQLCVRRDQLDLFSQYCAYQAIQAEVAKNDLKRAAKKRAA